MFWPSLDSDAWNEKAEDQSPTSGHKDSLNQEKSDRWLAEKSEKLQGHLKAPVEAGARTRFKIVSKQNDEGKINRFYNKILKGQYGTLFFSESNSRRHNRSLLKPDDSSHRQSRGGEIFVKAKSDSKWNEANLQIKIFRRNKYHEETNWHKKGKEIEKVLRSRESIVRKGQIALASLQHHRS